MLILKGHVSVVVGADYKLQMEVESICLSLTLHCMLKKKITYDYTNFLTNVQFKVGYVDWGTCWGETLKRLTEKKEDGQKIILAILIESLSSVRFSIFSQCFEAKYIFDKIMNKIEDVQILLIY